MFSSVQCLRLFVVQCFILPSSFLRSLLRIDKDAFRAERVTFYQLVYQGVSSEGDAGLDSDRTGARAVACHGVMMKSVNFPASSDFRVGCGAARHVVFEHASDVTDPYS